MRAPDPCEGEGPWLLVYRYHFVNDDGVTQVEETFDGLRFATEELAFACAAKLRTTGVRLPTLPRYGRDSNVMPDLITPMPSLCAVEQGIRPTRQPRGAADPAP
jgi:hypothetical protein